jgi:hypothetical protein
MIICHSRKFIFIHIHKTGGTSVERALDPHLAWNDLILGGSVFGEKIQQPYSRRFGLGKHSTVADIERVCGNALIEDYYVFSLVRHPLSRLCSVYNFVATTLQKWAKQQNIRFEDVGQHITAEAAKKKPGLKWASTKAFLESRGFAEFIRRPELTEAPGFRPQTTCLAGEEGGLKAEYFRLEDYPEWIAGLNGRLGLDFSLPRDNESRFKLVNDQSVSDEDRAYIESAFRRDYEIFGYTASPPRLPDIVDHAAESS